MLSIWFGPVKPLLLIVIVIDAGAPSETFKPPAALSVIVNASAFSAYESGRMGIDICFDDSFAAKFSVPRVAM